MHHARNPERDLDHRPHRQRAFWSRSGRPLVEPLAGRVVDMMRTLADHMGALTWDRGAAWRGRSASMSRTCLPALRVLP